MELVVVARWDSVLWGILPSPLISSMGDVSLWSSTLPPTPTNVCLWVLCSGEAIYGTSPCFLLDLFIPCYQFSLSHIGYLSLLVPFCTFLLYSSQALRLATSLAPVTTLKQGWTSCIFFSPRSFVPYWEENDWNRKEGKLPSPQELHLDGGGLIINLGDRFFKVTCSYPNRLHHRTLMILWVVVLSPLVVVCRQKQRMTL